MKKTSEAKNGLKCFGVGKMLPYLKKYRGMMLTMVLCGMAGSVIDIGTPLLQRYALNHFVGLGTLDTLVPFILLYVFVILFAGATNYVSAKNALWLEVRLDKDLRNRAFEHLQTLSFSYYSQNSVGYIHARVMSDTSRIGALFSWTVIDSVWQLAYVVGAIAAMLAVNARLALLVLSILLFSVVRVKYIALQMLIKLLLLPVLVSVTYEINRCVGRHDNTLTRILTAPGLWLQNFTTNEPDDSMIEVGIASLRAVLPDRKGQDEW